MFITVDSSGRARIVFTQTGENAIIQPQLITPSAVVQRGDAARGFAPSAKGGQNRAPTNHSANQGLASAKCSNAGTAITTCERRDYA